MASRKPHIPTTLGRGIRGKCPRCGEGELFQRWIVTHERCSACHLLYQRNYGDTWMFTNILDRVPILFGIAALFFGFRVTNLVNGILFLIALAVPMIATIRHRQGFALALDYLMRIWFPDPSDELHGGRELSQSEAEGLASRTA
ncbi:MAG TPA: hypothetical protein VEK57_22345 [Thermoanaerobaculia bacterium]|nr:hypothetical protein [Thermoanaerobaculia bacterium]